MSQINEKDKVPECSGADYNDGFVMANKEPWPFFIWSSHPCESHTCGHTGSNFPSLKTYS